MGLLISESTSLVSSLTNTIGVTLVRSAIIRSWEPAQCFFSAVVYKNMPIYHVFMGLLHGITNLGGALLAVYAKEMHTNKTNIRYVIAYYYLAFNSIQILVLVIFMGYIEIMIANAFTAIVSFGIYIFVGNRIFNAVSNQFFVNLLTLFILLYGVVILTQK